MFHYIATPNIGGDIPIDVPTNQNIGGDTSPASPAGWRLCYRHFADATELDVKLSCVAINRGL